MKDANTESFHDEKSKMAVYFVCAFPGLLGIAMLIAFFDSLSMSTPSLTEIHGNKNRFGDKSY